MQILNFEPELKKEVFCYEIESMASPRRIVIGTVIRMDKEKETVEMNYVMVTDLMQDPRNGQFGWQMMPDPAFFSNSPCTFKYSGVRWKILSLLEDNDFLIQYTKKTEEVRLSKSGLTKSSPILK
jgi:hypothetical protein